MFKDTGLTLLELLFTIAIIAIITSLGAPLVTSTQRHLQLKGAVQTVYFALQQARSSAISKGKDVQVVFQSGTNWCVALSDSGLCDCNKLNDCTIDQVEQKITKTDFTFIRMRDLKFAKDGVAVFDGFRGLAVGHAGSLVFTDGNQQLKLILSNMGRVRICALGVKTAGYKLC